MEITDLKQMTKEEVFNFIRQRLSFSKELQEQFRHVNKDDLAKEHRRFELSGNESKTGQCTICRSWHLWLYFLPFSRLPQWHSNRLSQILLRKWKFGIYIYRIYHNGNHLCNSWTDYLLRKAQKKSQLKKRIARKDNARSKDFYGFHLGTDYTDFTVPLD